MELVAVLHFDGGALFVSDRLLAEGAHLGLLSLFPHEGTSLLKTMMPYITWDTVWSVIGDTWHGML